MNIKNKIRTVLKNYYYDKDLRVYKTKITSKKQIKEIETRKKVAIVNYKNYLEEISKFHSINVMDKEINFFLKQIPKNSIICDIGGCWAWHWRNILQQRPDVKIFIIDLVIENFKIAKFFIGKNLNKRIYLINDDICNIKITNNVFDAIWSVQTLQHIPSYKLAMKNIFKILKNDGILFNYNLNKNPIIKFIYKIIGKKYLEKGYTPIFYLSRSSEKQKNIIEKIFENKVKTRYCEILFHPDIKLFFSGKKNSIVGKIDSLLSGEQCFKKNFARQECFIIKKN